MAHEYDPASPTLETDGTIGTRRLSLDKENLMKPEKVKSRWRRNSEMETQETNSEEFTAGTLKCVSENKDLDVDSKSSPAFEVLEENLYLFERKRTKHKKEVRRMLCECSLKEDSKVGCQDQCLNRLLMIECGSRCATGEACSNRRFQKRLYAKTEPFKTERKGWGLKVLEDIPRGNFVIEYVGEVLNSAQFKQRVKLYARDKRQRYYFMALKIDEIIDAQNKGNASRFINHSCDPNLQTEKWTVNGELRIGFFAKRDIKAEEELTFDYQLERYGRRAETCYCGSHNCKGYIGASDEITVDIDTNKKENRSNKRKKFTEKRKEVLEDLMLDEEIAKLSNGIRNKDETLMLARLMVRADDSHREKLLDIILNTTEVACLRLFLDYHGLTLLWSWMAYLNDTVLKTKILKVLLLLPVPNKTILMDSKVLNIVEMWASLNEEEKKKCTFSDKEHEHTKAKSCDTSDSETDATTNIRTSEHSAFSSSNGDKVILNCNVNMKDITHSEENTIGSLDIEEPSSMDNRISDTNIRSDDDSSDDKIVGSNRESDIVNIAKDLLASWKDLKEDFRIPRREKKDEKEDKKKDERDNLDEDIFSKEHEVKNQSIKHSLIKEDADIKNEKSPLFEEQAQEVKVVLPFQRKYSSSSFSKKLKEERRALFADQMQHRVRERKKNSCHYHASHSDYPSNENYQYTPTGDNSKLHHYVQNQYVYHAPRPPLLPTPGTTPPNVLCAGPHQPAEATVFTPNMFPPLPTQNFKIPLLSLPPPTIPSVIPEHPAAIAPCHAQNNIVSPLITIPTVNTPIVPIQVSASTEQLSTGYVKSQSQIEFICEEKPMIQMQTNFHTTQEPNQAYPVVQENGDKMALPMHTKITPVKLPPNWKSATDSDGNLYYYHIITRETQWDPPSIEVYDNETPTYDEPKERKHESRSRRSYKKHFSKRKSTTTAAADTSSSQVNDEIAKKIKELFRTKMSTYVVSCLNPYRKEDCKVGRISSTEDFKHLARKLTHFVMAKELKHCKNVEDLTANDSVKLKTKDYIRKYMNRYGKDYRKEKCVSLDD